jgi:hypothetical protein
MKTFAIVTLAAILAFAGAVQAATDEEKCRDTILKETGKYVKAQTKTLTKCNDSVVQNKDGFNDVLGDGCRSLDGKTQEKLDGARSKFLAAIDKKCGGDDKVCNTPDDLDLDNAAIGWGPSGVYGNGFAAICPDFESRGCTNIVRHCGGDDSDGEGVTDCVLCINDKIVNQTLEFLYADLDAAEFGTSNPINKCQQAFVKSSSKHFLSKHKTLAKCWQSLNKLKDGFSSSDAAGCIDASGKTAAKIDKSESKKIAGICKACGGPDDKKCDQAIATIAGTPVNAAGTGGDLDPLDDIGFGTACPDVTLPYAPGTACGSLDNLPSGSVDDEIENMQELVRCLDCVLEFKVDCSDRSVVPNHEGMPDECNACIEDTDGDLCPTTLQVTANGFDTRLDTGWTGVSHDFDVPTNGRLTLSLSNCDGTNRPTCGECDLSGPLPNAGGEKFNNHRCQGDNSITCNADSDCGAFLPCVYYFGVALPLSSGAVPICVTNEIQGTITGTANVDNGTSESNVELLSRVHLGETIERPCPTCEWDPVDARTECNAGPRVFQPCDVGSHSSIFGPLSFDCPPTPGGVVGSLKILLNPTTGTLTETLSAANPNCTASGHTTRECFCQTCDDATNTPCKSDADCGGGICGGLRCLGGPNNGDPCTAPSDCGGAPCSVPGQPTQPNQCSSAMCTPVPGDPDSIDEGECATGPFPGACSIERFRGCVGDGDCQCLGCVPGQTCLFEAQECFTDNGVVGGDVTVEGTPDPGCGNIANPELGTLFCVPPSQSSSVNAVAGSPGLARLDLKVEAIYNP